MSRRNTLENKRLRREARAEHKQAQLEIEQSARQFYKDVLNQKVKDLL